MLFISNWTVLRHWLVLFLFLASSSALAQGFNGAMSGSWWNPERAGEGQFISFEQVGNRQVAVVAYFTYDEAGQARWLVGNVDFEAGSRRLQIPMISGRGPVFGVDFNGNDFILEDAGMVELERIDCDQIAFNYLGTADSMSFTIERLIGPLDGFDCESSQQAPSTQTFSGANSGAWWEPTRGGEGQFLSVETLGDRQIAMFYYFTYDEQGQASWRVGNIDIDPEQSRLRVPLITGSGARFGSAFDAGDVVVESAGLATLISTGCGSMRLRLEDRVSFGLDLERLGGPLIDAPCQDSNSGPSDLDLELAALIDEHGLTGDASQGRVLPGINAPLAQLGKRLFFSKSLGAEQDVACASCHHPAFAGGDGLALSIGPGAENPDLVGPGRRLSSGEISMHRNANTYFNTGLFDRGLFWDSRVESLDPAAGQNGAEGGIRTPDSLLGQADLQAGLNLLTAQARFPVTARHEMRGDALPGLSGDEVRDHLAARLGDYGDGQGVLPPSQWLEHFQIAFDRAADAEELITFDSIALALGEYQRSAIFVENPWSQYVRGDLDAVTSQVKQGARLFFNRVEDGGVNCVRCHSGDLFTDQQHHRVGFPQIGPGFGDGIDDDWGRARETGLTHEVHAFRTPSLLNIELTAPYGHAGAYRSLGSVAGHYFNPTGTAIGQLSLRLWCTIPPFDSQPDCEDAFDIAIANSGAALDAMETDRIERPLESMPRIPVGLSSQARFDALEAFLRSLTDPCLEDPACYGRWVPTPNEAPDTLQLNAVNLDGNAL